MVFGTAIPTSLYIFGKCFSYLFVCLFVVPNYHTGGCLSLSSAPTPLVCMYVSVFVEKGLSPSGSKLWEVSVASKYDPADYRTVHRWNSLLRFLSYSEVKLSDVILGAYRLVESRWNNAAWCLEGLEENTSVRSKKAFVGLCTRTIGCSTPSLHEQSDSEKKVK